MTLAIGGVRKLTLQGRAARAIQMRLRPKILTATQTCCPATGCPVAALNRSRYSWGAAAPCFPRSKSAVRRNAFDGHAGAGKQLLGGLNAYFPQRARGSAVLRHDSDVDCGALGAAADDMA